MQTSEHLSPRGETVPPRVPVSPSEVSSQHKSSDVSTRSNSSSSSSSDTTLTDDAKLDIKILHDERPPATDTATWLDHEKDFDPDEYEALLSRSPRMMHQTSSKLLRLTEDDRPFTRVSHVLCQDAMPYDFFVVDIEAVCRRNHHKRRWLPGRPFSGQP